MEMYNLRTDSHACWGCKTCEVACKQENKTPDGVKLIHIFEEAPKVIDNKMVFLFQVQRCRHCEEPDCEESCADGAIKKRSDGIVILDESKCSGCEACVVACPYQSIDFDDNRGIAQKCNLCYQRIDKGLIPACADNVCLAHCIHFGTQNELAET